MLQVQNNSSRESKSLRKTIDDDDKLDNLSRNIRESIKSFR